MDRGNLRQRVYVHWQYTQSKYQNWVLKGLTQWVTLQQPPAAVYETATLSQDLDPSQ